MPERRRIIAAPLSPSSGGSQRLRGIEQLTKLAELRSMFISSVWPQITFGEHRETG
jgi:hypothetical protein